MQLAIFGGSFDPVHIAHEAIVKKAIDSLEIDSLIVVPTYLNPFKSSFHFEPKTRLKLIKKVFKNNPKVYICDYEIEQNRSVYSIETVSYLKNLYKPSKIFIIIGEDNIKDLNKWAEIENLKKIAEFVVATRKTHENEQLKNFRTIDIDIDISSTTLRENLDLDYIPEQIKEDIINLQTNKKR